MTDIPIHVHLLTGCTVRALERDGQRFYLMRLASGDEAVTNLLVSQQGLEELLRQIDAAMCASLAAGMQ